MLFCSVFNRISIEKSLVQIVDTLSIVQKQFIIEKLERYKNNKDFNYAALQETTSIFDQVKAWFVRSLRKIMSWFFDDIETPVGFLLSLLKVLPYALLVLLVYLIIKFFLKVIIII